jgi:hypothetical protein
MFPFPFGLHMLLLYIWRMLYLFKYSSNSIKENNSELPVTNLTVFIVLENTTTNHWYRRPWTTGPNPIQYLGPRCNGWSVFSRSNFGALLYSPLQRPCSSRSTDSLPRGRAAFETRRWRGGAWRSTQPQAPHPGFGSRPPPTTCSSPHGIRWELSPRLAVPFGLGILSLPVLLGSSLREMRTVLKFLRGWGVGLGGLYFQ